MCMRLLFVMTLAFVLTASCTRSSTGSSPDAATGADGGLDAAVQLDAAGGDAGTQADAALLDAEVGQDAASNVCVQSAECANGMFCDKTSCTAPTGTCVQIPFNCPDTRTPVCGCDGVNYWNNCLRRQRDMALDHQGKCGAGSATCGGFGGILCPGTNVDCAYLDPLQTTCMTSDPMGVCWVTPTSCPAVVIGGSWRPCYGGPTAPCEPLCEAIQSSGLYWNDSSCPQ
jgi:hypothetical protein